MIGDSQKTRLYNRVDWISGILEKLFPPIARKSILGPPVPFPRDLQRSFDQVAFFAPGKFADRLKTLDTIRIAMTRLVALPRSFSTTPH